MPHFQGAIFIVFSNLTEENAIKVEADYFEKTPFRDELSNYFINTLLIDRKGGCDTLDLIDKIIEVLDEEYSL